MNKQITRPSYILKHAFVLLCMVVPATIAYSEDPAVSPGFLLELLHFAEEYTNGKDAEYLSPSDVCIVENRLLVLNRTGKRLDFISLSDNKKTASLELPRSPSGMAVSADNKTLYITCSSGKRPMGIVAIVDLDQKAVVRSFSAGHSPKSPVTGKAGKLLYVCNQFLNGVGVYEIATGQRKHFIPLIREPFAAALSKDGAILVINNYLPFGRSDLPVIDGNLDISAHVSLVSTATHRLIRHIPLADGAHSLSDVAISTDDNHAYITGVFSRYAIPPTRIELGWINSNGISVIDIRTGGMINTVLLDDANKGAANCRAVDVSDDLIFVSAAGSHELITLEEKTLLAKLKGKSNLSYEFTFAKPFRNRFKLKGKGPRSLAVKGRKAYVANYFTDDIEVVDCSSKPVLDATIVLGTSTETQIRKGERLFYDASICKEGWQTCHSCHPLTRTDGLNWDLLNDGMGNPKNDKSLLLSHYTPPSMASGIRDSAEIAVRAGIEHILYSVPREEDARAMDAYLKSLRPVPSPYLVDGRLSASARRGKQLFYGKLKCNVCHPPPLYTDKMFHVLGTKGKLDRRSDFDTPTLIENWRTAPYLHDGRYATLKELFKEGKHGIVIPVSDTEIDDLIEFNNSL